MNTPKTPIEFFNEIIKEGRTYRFGDYSKYLEKEKASSAGTQEAQNLTQVQKLKLRN